MAFIDITGQDETARRRALGHASQSLADAIGDGADRAETKRRRAFEERQNVLSTTVALRNQGFDVSPDQVDQFMKSEGGAEGIQGLFANRTPEFEQKQADARAQRRILGLEEKKLRQDLDPEFQAEQLTRKKQIEAQATLDKEQGKDLAEFINRGGYAETKKNLDQLDLSIELLEKEPGITGAGAGFLADTAESGGFTGAIAKALESKVNPKGRISRESVRQVVQTSLRQTLGAQFTEKEGKGILDRAFDSSLSPQENVRRVKALRDSLIEAAKVKQAAADYMAKNGTLKGFRLGTPEAVFRNTYSSKVAGSGPSVDPADVPGQAPLQQAPGQGGVISNVQADPSEEMRRRVETMSPEQRAARKAELLRKAGQR